MIKRLCLPVWACPYPGPLVRVDSGQCLWSLSDFLGVFRAGMGRVFRAHRASARRGARGRSSESGAPGGYDRWFGMNCYGRGPAGPYEEKKKIDVVFRSWVELVSLRSTQGHPLSWCPPTVSSIGVSRPRYLDGSWCLHAVLGYLVLGSADGDSSGSYLPMLRYALPSHSWPVAVP